MSVEARRVGENAHCPHYYIPSHEQQVKKPLSTVDDHGGAAWANVRVDPSCNRSVPGGDSSVDEKAPFAASSGLDLFEDGSVMVVGTAR